MNLLKKEIKRKAIEQKEFKKTRNYELKIKTEMNRALNIFYKFKKHNLKIEDISIEEFRDFIIKYNIETNIEIKSCDNISSIFTFIQNYNESWMED